jgi:hypothetical protein
VVAAVALVVVTFVVGTNVEPTKALARPAPNRAIEATTMVGRMRRRARDRVSMRAPFARLAAIR